MNKLIKLVQETREDFWRDDCAKKLVDNFEKKAEIAFSEFFRSHPYSSLSCRVFGIQITDIVNCGIALGEIICNTDVHETDAECEDLFLKERESEGYYNLDVGVNFTFMGRVSLKGLQPFFEELNSRRYKVLNQENGEDLLIYFIVSE